MRDVNNSGEQRLRRMLSERGTELSEEENAMIWDSDPQSMTNKELDEFEALHLRISKVLIDTIYRLGKIPERAKGRFWQRAAEDVSQELDLKNFTAQAARKRFLRFPEDLKTDLTA